MALAVKVPLNVASDVFRIGAASETSTVVDASPTFSFTLNVGVCSASRENGGTLASPKPAAFTFNA